MSGAPSSGPASAAAVWPADGVPTRTRLTTPPGQLPAEDLAVGGEERYSPGLEIPREPLPPAKHRGAGLLAAGAAIVVLIIAVIALLTSDQQAQDPALDVPLPVESPEA